MKSMIIICAIILRSVTAGVIGNFLDKPQHNISTIGKPCEDHPALTFCPQLPELNQCNPYFKIKCCVSCFNYTKDYSLEDVKPFNIPDEFKKYLVDYDYPASKMDSSKNMTPTGFEKNSSMSTEIEKSTIGPSLTSTTMDSTLISTTIGSTVTSTTMGSTITFVTTTAVSEIDENIGESRQTFFVKLSL